MVLTDDEDRQQMKTMGITIGNGHRAIMQLKDFIFGRVSPRQAMFLI